MLALCEEIKASGVAAPWTYQGQYPSYVSAVMTEMIWKNGGIAAIANIDNLHPDAWRQDAVRAAVEGLAQLAERDLIMPGTEALSHTDSQAQWLQGKAVFIPCGSWLENEMKDVTPADFQMTFAPTPAQGTAVPFQGVSTFFGQPFAVPTEAKNSAGGKEFIRLLCSKENANFFSGYTHSLTTIIGAGEGMDYGPPSTPPSPPSPPPATTSSPAPSTPPGTSRSATKKRSRWAPS
jgi:N-acetylglucosamine transport system substrate-binding protein